ncbi:trans-acting regulatory HvrA protein [Halorhodospira abdelmalekii]|uniref:H-NS histone family protein n=1 Tax=Halorhodospira abdelmalekii TaxID=421629 RepID=UPI001905E16C|nr:H-NS histone family protein [Halorhodospira abdelmalekii]MBK1734613.1 trans-acting regulatory HvrA protein [Halorhodospira abdelmalekii]
MSEEQLEQIAEAARELDLNALDRARQLIEQERRRREREARRQAQQEMKAVAEKYGMSLHEIVAGQPKSASGGSGKGKLPPKYRHPHDHSKTWTGRGRRPHWIQEWIDGGNDLDDLKIAD